MQPLTNFDAKQFRQALGAFATGVTVITTTDEAGCDVGLTANSFNSVSLDPPMVLWSLDKKSSSFEAFQRNEHFAVHILACDQDHVSNKFAKSGGEKFEGLEITRGEKGLPLLTGCSARFICRTFERYEGGDHVILVGQVITFEDFKRAPLVFHSGKYSLVLNRDLTKLDELRSVGIDWLGYLLRRTYDQFMTPLRKRLRELGLNDVHYHILNILSMSNGREVTQLGHLVSFTGLQTTDEHLDVLKEKGLIQMEEQVDGMFVNLTPQGLKLVLNLLSQGVSLEWDALQGFDNDEISLLKNLLHRITNNTATNIPPEWRKENYWFKDNPLGGRDAHSQSKSIKNHLPALKD